MDPFSPPSLESESSSRNVKSTLTVPESFPSDMTEKERNSFDAPPTPQTRGRSRTFSQLATSIISPSTEKPPLDVTGLTNLTSDNSIKPDKALQETRKLLSHILHELQGRPQPPSVWDAFHPGQGARKPASHPLILKAGLKIASSNALRSGSLAGDDSNSDEEFDTTFSLELTFDLLNKLRDVLIVARLKSWQIFDDGPDNGGPNTVFSEKPPFRFRRSSFNTSGRRARSFSPNRLKPSSSGLLSRCIATLNWIILEDCRYQIKSIRLTRPPNALQALTLDIWQILIYMHRSNAKVLHDIGLAALPAFSTFPKSMHKRLFLFFERGLLRVMLLNLRGLQNTTLSSQAISDNQADHNNQLGPPVVAIQVDEAKDDELTVSNPLEGWKRWSPPNNSFQGILSSYAPAQPMEVYYLASLIAPLMATILDNVDPFTQDLVLSHHLQAFFSFLSEYKNDTATDLLQIVAYHTAQARHSAIALLLTYWPKAFGHLSIAKPILVLRHAETLEKTSLIRARQDPIHPHHHQFLPWHFNPTPSSALFEGSSFHDCHSCHRQITDFGLLCPFCICAVHFNCYDAPDGSHLSHYPVPDELGTQRVAVHRYSYIQSDRLEAAVVRKGHHAFRLVNIFTLSLCGVCGRPLWGYIAQGYRCGACNQYVHCSCMDGEAFDRLPSCHSEPDTSRIIISWTELRASFIDFYREVLLEEEDIGRCSYEELSIFWSLLWMQLQLLKYGIASGSVIVTQDRPSSADSQAGVDNFELHHLEKLYDAYLASDRLQMTPMMEDVLQKNGCVRRFRLLLFDWPILLYVASVARSPMVEGYNAHGESLLAAVSSAEDDTQWDLDVQPAEVVSVAHLRDVLGQQFGLRKPQAACIILGHLRHLGFFHGGDLPESFFTSCDKPTEVMCRFPLPLGLDISTSVEFLIAAIEACFEDLDISVNESGFLLLVRRLWPNGMFSDYALSRLIRAVLSWILSEDDNLVIILREYVAKNRHLPGVPSTAESYTWPDKHPSRSSSSGSVNNGNDYVACRKCLLEKYATRWLFAVHCQDPDMYASLIFETVSDLAMDSVDADPASMYGDGTPKEKESLSHCADKALRSIMKICQYSIAFSTVDDLFLKWLEVFPSKLSSQKPLTTLPRLFNRDTEGTARWTSAFDATITSFEHISAPLLDPWRVVIGVAARDYDGMRKGLDWLCIFASSGVDIPVNTFLQMSALARDLNAPFEDHLKLSKAAFMATWIKSLGRQELHRMISDLHDRYVTNILSQLADDENTEQIYTFFRLTLSSFLLMFGCDRKRLQDLGLIREADHKGLSRRKTVKRASIATDIDVEDVDFIEIIFRYVEDGTDELRCLITKFLVCFLTESSLLTAPELEAMILRNSFYLTRWKVAWKIYDMQTPDVNDFRATLLLRILVVDTRHFDELLTDYYREESHWERRLTAATRLFQVVLDVTKPSFSVEGRQWRSNVMQIFYRFFSSMWLSDREEIRLSVDTWAQTLQQAHQESMTQCFSELLARAPVPERLELASFLLQLRSHFPSWKVLTWDVIIETLMDDEFMQRTDADESAIAAHLSMYGISSTQQGEAVGSKDPDMSALHSSLILLSLQMIADGISIDTFSYLKLKMQLIGLIGFSGATLVPASSGHSFHVQFGELKSLNAGALPCLQGVMSLLDAYRLFDLAPSAMTASGAEDDTTYPVLIGSVILDVFLALFQNLLDNFSDFPYPQIKLMLQSLVIVIYKHDVEVLPLRHLRETVRRTVKRVSGLLLKDIGGESKQLVLTAIQAYRKRWLNYASSRDLLVNQVSDIISFIASSAKDDFLVGQAISLLEDIFMVHSGTFYHLSKQLLTEGTFFVIRLVVAKNARNVDAQVSLPDVILRDTLQFLVSIHNDAGRKHSLDNLKTYIETVYHQGYSSDTLSLVGESVVSILRNASELSEESFDPSPLLLAISALIQYNKAQVRGLLHHLESAVRIALVRFDVTEHALRRLLQVTSTLFRRNASEAGASAQERNVILAAVIDVLSDGLRAKCRVTPTTLKAIVDSLCKPGLNYASNSSLSRLGRDALFYLQNSASLDLHSDHSLLASRAASLLFIDAENQDKGLLYRYLSENAYERSSRHMLSTRAWNVLALESLQCTSDMKSTSQLFENFASFSVVYHTSLRAHSQTVGLPPDITASEINQAYIAIKLWLLLARKCSEEALEVDEYSTVSGASYASEDRNASLVWNELWPPFERLVSLSETDVEMGDLTPIATLVWSSIADILLFLRLMRSTISLETASHIAIVNRIRTLAKGESSTSKFSRTLKSISEPPTEVPLASLIAQTMQELLAAEKLHALETRRDLGRMVPDRSKRDLRMQTG